MIHKYVGQILLRETSLFFHVSHLLRVVNYTFDFWLL